MTLQQRRQRNTDIFDTGPFAGYTGFGNGGDENGSSGAQQADTSSANAVVWSYSNKLLSYSETYNILMNDYGFSDNDIWDMIGGDPDTGGTETQQMVQQHIQDMTSKAELEAPQTRTLYAPNMQYDVRNVGIATKAGQKIPGTQFEYWNGDIDDHNWKLHGISTVKHNKGYDPVLGNYDLKYPEVMVDSMGSYGMAITHYIARYNPEDATEFYGFEVLRPGEVEGGVPAGVPIATVIQMFVKPGYDPEGRDWDDYSFGGTLGSEDIWREFEINPVWRFANGMKMGPESFYLLEPELAERNKLPAITDTYLYDQTDPNMLAKVVPGGWKRGEARGFAGGMWHALTANDKVYISDLEKLEDVGYQGIKSIFKNGMFGASAPKKRAVLNGEYGGRTYFGMVFSETNKKDHAAKVEWLGEDGAFGAFSRFPKDIKDCNEYGKTMAIFRFPKQLDPQLARHKEWLDHYAKDPNAPDYTIGNTKYCYPYPSAGGSGYALIGRLPMDYASGGSSDKIGDLQPGQNGNTVDIGGVSYGARMSIKFTPMIKPKTHVFGAYRMNEGGYGFSWNSDADGIMASSLDIVKTRTMDIRFDTTSVAGAQVSVADPDTKAYFESSKIVTAYFNQYSFDIGGSGFAIGQCLLPYEATAASVDAALGKVYSSERIIISREAASRTINMLNTAEGGVIRSNDVQERPEKTGKLAGSLSADYLPPIATITVDDLRSDRQPPSGMLAVEDAHREIFGREITENFIADLPKPLPDVTYDSRNPNRYVFRGRSFPFTILVFNIPGYYKGPILRYNNEGQPIGPSATVSTLSSEEGDQDGRVVGGPGFIGTNDVWCIYQTPFGTRTGTKVNFHKIIQAQKEIEEAGGSPEDVLTSPDTSWGELFDLTPTSDVQNEYMTAYNLVKDEIRAELLAKYGNMRWTNSVWNQRLNFWNEDYVTGEMLINAGYKIPGVDYTEFEARLDAVNAEYQSVYEQLETEGSLYRKADQVSGFGAFTNPHGFTVTDVTAKWGTMEAANSRYTGDVGMSMVPYNANVKNEQLGYMAMSNLSGLGYPGEDVVDDAKDFAADVTLEAAKWSGLGVGLGLGGAVIMLAGGVAVSIAAKGAGEAVWTILNKKKPNSI